VRTSAGAFAQSGALLYGQIVLNPEAYPRDRIEAWQKLGSVSGVIANENKRGDAEKNDSDAGVLAASAALTELVGFLREVIQPREVIEGKVNDTRNE
jgi:hypothetical protein